MGSLPVFVRSHLQIDGPYNEAFLEKLQKCPAEDDGSVEYAVAKVGLVPNISRPWRHTENRRLFTFLACFLLERLGWFLVFLVGGVRLNHFELS